MSEFIAGSIGAVVGSVCTFLGAIYISRNNHRNNLMIVEKNRLDAVQLSEKNRIDALGLADRNRRIDASARLYCAFAPTIIKLQNTADNPSHEDMNIIRNNLAEASERQAIAIYEFKFFLSSEERISIDTAWQEHQTELKEGYEYWDSGMTPMRIKARQLALERINKILEFAEHKSPFIR